MNHKILPTLLFALFTLTSGAQTSSGYMPFHQYFQQHNGNIQSAQGNERAVIFKEIGYSHNVYQPQVGTWIYADSGVFTYGQIGNEVYETNGSYYTFSNATLTWPIKAQVTNTANGIGLLTTSTYQVGDSGNWTNSSQYLYTYNPANNYLASQTLQTWSGSAWVDSIAYIYTYNVNNYDSIVVFQTAVGGVLQNDSQYLYTYEGYQNTQTITQAWSGSAWVNAFNKYTTFDPNGNPAQSQIYHWNGSSWSVYEQEVTDYDGYGELNNYTLQVWSPEANGGLGAYINYYSEVYENSLGNNVQFNSYQWDTTQSPETSKPLLQYTYAYDENHNVLYESDQTYAADTFGYTDQYFYNYSDFNVTGVNTVVHDLRIGVYPNPSTGLAVLNLSMDKANEVSVKICDAVGKELKITQVNTTAGFNQIPLNLAGFASGIYFVEVADRSGKSSTLKLVKE